MWRFPTLDRSPLRGAEGGSDNKKSEEKKSEESQWRWTYEWSVALDHRWSVVLDQSGLISTFFVFWSGGPWSWTTQQGKPHKSA